MAATTYTAGDKVRLTGAFLKSTGQTTGSEGMGRWTVIACDCGLCSRGRFIATDEVSSYDGGPRHFAIGNVQRATRR